MWWRPTGKSRDHHYWLNCHALPFACIENVLPQVSDVLFVKHLWFYWLISKTTIHPTKTTVWIYSVEGLLVPKICSQKYFPYSNIKRLRHKNLKHPVYPQGLEINIQVSVSKLIFPICMLS